MLLAIHEVMANGWVVWEDNKYVSVSRRRFASVSAVGPAGLRLEVRGAVGEVVGLTALRPTWRRQPSGAPSGWTVALERATIGPHGMAVVEWQ